MMRTVKITLAAFIIAGLIVPMLGCGSKSDEAEMLEKQVVTVQRGNLTVDITAAGNLALSRTEDLAFDLFYQEGTVEEVLVEEGDTVEEGQVLAKLDISEWEEELETLEDQVTAAERQLTTKQRNLLQAELNLINAEIALEDAEAVNIWPEDIFSARQEVRKYENSLENAEQELEEAVEAGVSARKIEILTDRVNSAKEKLGQAQLDLDKLLAASYGETEEVTIKRLQLEIAQGQLEDAQIAIEDAQEDLEDAQEELDEAKSKSPVITAPFAGFITKVNVEGGDEVLTGTVAVQLADPNEFEADILVNEMDYLKTKLGGNATVQVDAMPGLSLPAKVAHISPTATIQSGVVNYKVKVDIESLESVMQERQVPMAIPEDLQLREGLTVTVSIIVDERTDVLLVPNGAIITSGGQTYVQVVLPDGTFEERAITTGISNWQYTEVTEGLSEGEQLIVPQGTATTTTTPQQGLPGKRFIPGMGK